MKSAGKIILASLATALLLLGAAPSTETVTGEVVDSVCFHRSGADGHGADHAECAKACIERGNDVGLLSAEGDLYILRPADDAALPRDRLAAHAGMIVEVTGELGEEDGIPTLTVEEYRFVRSSW